VPQQLALYMQDKHPIAYELEAARYAESRGFDAIWQADTRLARDGIVLMSAFLATTQKLILGTGVLPIWTRNAAVIAATFSTMYELAPGRVLCGLGAWWEPISSQVGVRREKPLQAMREYVECIRALFTMEEVTFKGEFVNVEGIRLDVIHGDTTPRHIPLYIGATGPKMLELTGEIADGCVLNYMVSPAYIREACGLLARGAARSGKTLADVDRPELIVCSLSEDRQAALDEARALVVQYLAQEPHIMKASGVSEELLNEVRQVLGWPATKEQVQAAMKLVPDDVVQMITASGTPAECRAKVREYMEAGCTCPILYPLMPDVYPVIDAFTAHDDWRPGASTLPGAEAPG
jgi:5,10-methylenetetrahydromethanopterin reductase